MFGSKMRRENADLKRLLRVQAGKLAETEEDLRATRYAARRAAELVAEQAAPAAVSAEGDVEHSELWSLIDWSLWGSGMGDVFREQLADQFIRAITPQQHEQALRLIQAWTDSGREPLGRRRYEEQQARLHRAVAACRRYRKELAVQARVTNRLASSLLDATGSKGAYLLPEEREVLGLTNVEVAS
ncbi:hypothetical protein [Streptomyces erythrochromogenes]|uniref:hypothetical protein n=1 Tax=Streptomyces erythrochromogenes TaxID=285574 RepID=UPI0022516230|nr:hypothetical protein [Streptomyces erythrochromogenes]MCX5587603.1 hypothetical protein [Streptomyces erythrochromogenes]